MSITMRTDYLHVGGIERNPFEVESLDVIDCVFHERVPGSGSHKRVVYANGESRRGHPVDGEEEIHRLEALYVQVKVYTTHLIENKVSDDVGALNLYSGGERLAFESAWG